MTRAASGTEDISDLFRVIGHPSRMGILLALVAGEHGVSALEQKTAIGQPGLSQQLAILRKAELVATRREAKQVFYSLNPATLHVAREAIEKLCSAADDKDAFVPRAIAPGPVGAAMFARVQPRS
ncbi:helix-turn-helix transcriptional regulator [Novosphingobium sp. ERN07]|uniref:ArsR/SmtB family transcription factor n=1 Tax=Novosphingobium sp. ERN07 TaxID=2726187 RepID=UPI00145701B9|nr:metalloregulator ArsR/SmtB family transcription factor [Novosphingobium sp. ERN07]NLR72165.1 helix-turn-helix transcriptional regulator [Novosphingobium sp. ERN07]